MVESKNPVLQACKAGGSCFFLTALFYAFFFFWLYCQSAFGFCLSGLFARLWRAPEWISGLPGK